jgi:hypothetical protein
MPTVVQPTDYVGGAFRQGMEAGAHGAALRQLLKNRLDEIKAQGEQNRETLSYGQKLGGERAADMIQAMPDLAKVLYPDLYKPGKPEAIERSGVMATEPEAAGTPAPITPATPPSVARPNWDRMVGMEKPIEEAWKNKQEQERAIALEREKERLQIEMRKEMWNNILPLIEKLRGGQGAPGAGAPAPGTPHIQGGPNVPKTGAGMVPKSQNYKIGASASGFPEVSLSEQDINPDTQALSAAITAMAGALGKNAGQMQSPVMPKDYPHWMDRKKGLVGPEFVRQFTERTGQQPTQKDFQEAGLQYFQKPEDYIKQDDAVKIIQFHGADLKQAVENLEIPDPQNPGRQVPFLPKRTGNPAKDALNANLSLLARQALGRQDPIMQRLEALRTTTLNFPPAIAPGFRPGYRGAMMVESMMGNLHTQALTKESYLAQYDELLRLVQIAGNVRGTGQIPAPGPMPNDRGPQRPEGLPPGATEYFDAKTQKWIKVQ